MNVTLPALPAPFTALQPLVNAISRALTAAFAKGEDVRLQRGERFILKSPNGSLFVVGVDDLGNVTTDTLP